MTDKCPRDAAGFCQIAMRGHRNCFRGAHGVEAQY